MLDLGAVNRQVCAGQVELRGRADRVRRPAPAGDGADGGGPAWSRWASRATWPAAASTSGGRSSRSICCRRRRGGGTRRGRGGRTRSTTQGTLCIEVIGNRGANTPVVRCRRIDPARAVRSGGLWMLGEPDGADPGGPEARPRCRHRANARRPARRAGPAGVGPPDRDEPERDGASTWTSPARWSRARPPPRRAACSPRRTRRMTPTFARLPGRDGRWRAGSGGRVERQGDGHRAAAGPVTAGAPASAHGRAASAEPAPRFTSPRARPGIDHLRTAPWGRVTA